MNGYKKEKINASLSETNGNQKVFDCLFFCVFVLTALGLLLFAWAFSSCGARASYCGGFSCGAQTCGLQQLWLPGSRAQSQ